MKAISGIRILIMVLVATCLSVSSFVVYAQEKEMTVEELEKYIEEQKKVLEEVRANRDQTQAQAEAIRKELEEQKAHRLMVEEELVALCKDRDVVQPGTFEECVTHADN